ncbi:metal ABC transporter substrate-binding protein [Nocardioides coralli]|uniref:metal ABC transporter substrate-binding protein n=1 Tax=Nocardioides coralli TaxID=2872154 RepID=UPI001CA3D13B|nr:metal ABC transporter substrate-binding protein [Nocardioides coralli]QZY30288.1 metal ABC transporter substrate-binding protein [Nocardioides coralli]
MLSATRRWSPLVAALASVSLLAGCGAAADEGAEGREVVASFYPLAWVSERVAGDGWTVTNLTAPGQDSHDLELSIDATARLSEADLVVYLEGFQPAVDDGIDVNASGPTLEAGEVVDLVPALDHGAEEHDGEAHGDGESHADEGTHADEETHDEEHDHGDLDPHFWQDPERMALLAEAVADELAELDPENAGTFRGNAEELVEELTALDADYEEGLSGCRRDIVVASHDAFGYLEKYDLHVEAIAGLDPGTEPTPAVLAELADLIRDEGLTTVFSERLASPEVAETLAADLGIETAVLDPLEGLTDETAEDDYLSLMRANLTALEEANGC